MKTAVTNLVTAVFCCILVGGEATGAVIGLFGRAEPRSPRPYGSPFTVHGLPITGHWPRQFLSGAAALADR